MTVTIEHEAPLEVCQRFPELIPKLLRDVLQQPVPQGLRVKPGPTNFNQTVAQELRSDQSFICEDLAGQAAVVAVIESQRDYDEDKLYSWPVYLAVLHRQYRCKAYLLVLAPSRSLAAQLRQPIETFQPGKRFGPYVIGPDEIAAVQSVEEARSDLPISVLSALLHAREEEGEKTAASALQAVYEERGVDWLTWLYGLIRAIVSDDDRLLQIERMLMLDPWQNYVPRTPFEREHFGRGRVEGKIEALLNVLTARGLAPTDEQRRQIELCKDAERLSRWIVGAVTARSVDELLASD